MNRSKHILLLVIEMVLWSSYGYCQKDKISNCGYYSKDLKSLKQNFDRNSKFLGLKTGDVVASVGAGNGSIEIQTSSFIDSLHWTLQDINADCLNRANVENMILHHESLINKTIKATFEIVIGEQTKTNLAREAFDRLLLINVYHELVYKNKILDDIRGALRPTGLLVVMERMANKRGETHGDCGHPRLVEQDLVAEMKNAGFEMVSKQKPDKKLPTTFYTFKKI